MSGGRGESLAFTQHINGIHCTLYGHITYRLSGNDALLPVILGHSWEAVISPMWLFAMSSIPLYAVLLARVLVQDGMWKNILQSCVSYQLTVNCYWIFLLHSTMDSLATVFLNKDVYVLVMYTYPLCVRVWHCVYMDVLSLVYTCIWVSVMSVCACFS